MLSQEDFLRMVRDAPLVSFDLLARDEEGNVLLGLRSNAPARGYWFVPGGVLRKDERFEQAFRRICQAELGLARELAQARFAGVYEHLYDDNFADEPGVSTHYVALAWELPIGERPERLPTGQHREYRWVPIGVLAADPTIHPNSRAYAAALSPAPPGRLA